ncbi:MAG: NfeD family protein [Phormidesmis sp.]
MFLGLLLNSPKPASKNNTLSKVPTKAPAKVPTYVSPGADYFQEKANVVKSISGCEKGRVQLHGVYWFARLANPMDDAIEPGCRVAVVGRENNMLIVSRAV